MVGAGQGTRFGGLKQLELIEGVRVVDLSIQSAYSISDGVTFVAPPDRLADFSGVADCVVAGGASRSESVRLGLDTVAESVDFVLIHDAARPLATHSLYRKVVLSLQNGAQAVVPLISVVDSLKRVNEDGKVESVNRDRLFQAQTPQGFTQKCIRLIAQSNLETTDEVGAAEILGVDVNFVDGDYANIKITSPQDLDVVRVLAKRIARGEANG